jgi:hypothetical protein
VDNIPDPAAKTVHVPVRIEKGQVTLLHGGKKLVLKNGATGTLILYASTILDEELRKQLSQVTSVELLPTGARLMADVNPRNSSETDRDVLRKDSRCGYIHGTGHFHIALHLHGPLLLQLKGTKKPSLLPCPITIPALDGQPVESVNEAYTVVSQRYEAHRRSHSGNVFQKVLFLHRDDWRPLKELRERVEAGQDPRTAQMKLGV